MMRTFGLEKFSLPPAVTRILWGLFLFSLPITSFPFFPPAFGGDALVRPLSIYPLIILALAVILPRLIRKPVPKAVLVLVPFVALAIASSFLSLLRGIEPALGISVQSRVLRGILTLAIGCAFYLALAILPENLSDLRFTLRWIYLGCAASMLWASLQAIYIIDVNPSWFEKLSKIQGYLSTRRLLPDRISGPTYEPHWFAAQLILLLLPWTLAAVINNYTVFRFRLGRITIEALLTLWGIVLVPFTYSRAGVINLVGLMFCAVLLRPYAWKSHSEGQGSFLQSRVTRMALEGLVAIIIVATPVYIIGTKNPFFSRLWSYWQTQDGNLTEYLSYLGFEARLAYAEAAYNTYQEYPLMGVGLGNYAFYFEEMLPYHPISTTPEVLLMITPEMGRDRLITSKNLYLRLLAETGITGAIAFTCFIIAVSGCALYLWLSPEKRWRYWGQASILGLVAFALSAMTFDSFVIPNMWVVFGLITAATKIAKRVSPS